MIAVLIPYRLTAGQLESPSYETPEYRRDVASWFEPLGRTWCWQPVTMSDVPEFEIHRLLAIFGRDVTYFNLCDGAEIDHYPGLSVVKALEQAGVAFTGAGSQFFAETTYKSAMKTRLRCAGLATADFVLVEDEARDLLRIEHEIGFPAFVKPDVSAAAGGINEHSRVVNMDELRRQVQWLQTTDHVMPSHGVLVERFIDGPEFTALVFEDAEAPDGVRVLPPLERAYHVRLPHEHRYLTFEVYDKYTPDQILPHLGGALFLYQPAPKEIEAAICELASRSFRALGGSGYARVDMRLDRESGVVQVLEVNANCGLGNAPDSTTGHICRLAGWPFHRLIEKLLATAMQRKRS